MAVGVVDRFEAVQVRQDHGSSGLDPLKAAELFGRHVLERGTVEEPGEAILAGDGS
jgi:hypothetical protein